LKLETEVDIHIDIDILQVILVAQGHDTSTEYIYC